MQRVADPLQLFKRNGNGHCDGVDVPPKHAQPGIRTARSYVEPTEWDPVRIPQRADNGPTRETRTRVDSAGHRATSVPPPISRRLRSIVRKRGIRRRRTTWGDERVRELRKTNRKTPVNSAIQTATYDRPRPIRENPLSTNRRQNNASAWNSGPAWIHGDDAARVCDAWYFALHA